MKGKIFIIGIIIIVIGVVIFMVLRSNKKVDISSIKHFSFSYSKGYAANSYIRYSMVCSSDGCDLEIKPYGVSDDDKLDVRVGLDFSKKIEDVLEKYNVGSWNGFNKTDKNVLDGDSFSLYARMENDDSISASGYMRWPDNYSSVRDEIDNIFMEIYDNKK